MLLLEIHGMTINCNSLLFQSHLILGFLGLLGFRRFVMSTKLIVILYFLEELVSQTTRLISCPHGYEDENYLILINMVFLSNDPH